MGLFAFIPKMPAPTSPAEKEELAMSYAALILHDDGLPITEENLGKILAAANVKVQPFWPRVFAKILDGKDADTINDIIMGVELLLLLVVQPLLVQLQLKKLQWKKLQLKKKKKNLMKIWDSVYSIKRCQI